MKLCRPRISSTDKNEERQSHSNHSSQCTSQFPPLKNSSPSYPRPSRVESRVESTECVDPGPRAGSRFIASASSRSIKQEGQQGLNLELKRPTTLICSNHLPALLQNTACKQGDTIQPLLAWQQFDYHDYHYQRQFKSDRLSLRAKVRGRLLFQRMTRQLGSPQAGSWKWTLSLNSSPLLLSGFMMKVRD